MALRVRFEYVTAAKLNYSIEQLCSGYVYDFVQGVFVPRAVMNVTNILASLPEDVTPFLGSYIITLTATPWYVFIDGDYTITVHDANASNVVRAKLASTMRDGDDGLPDFAKRVAQELKKQ